METRVWIPEMRHRIEWRQDESRQGPGRLTGTLIEYETRALDRPEMVANGALDWAAKGIVLNLQHNRKAFVVRFSPMVEGRALLVDLQLPDTQNGRDAATSVRNGTLTGLSPEFVVMRERMQGGLRHILKARLTGASLVDDSSYETKVEVRHKRLPRLWL